jgi:hypothetical protein
MVAPKNLIDIDKHINNVAINNSIDFTIKRVNIKQCYLVIHGEKNQIILQ